MANRITGLKQRLIPSALLLSLAGLFIISSPVTAAPGLSLSPSAGAVGTVVTMTGTLFDSYKGDQLYVYFSGSQIAGSPVTVPETGTFTATFNVPTGTAPGVHAVQVKLTPDAASLIAAATFNVETTRLLIDIVSGQVGTMVTLTGAGFFSNSAVLLYYHNPVAGQVGTVVSSATGRFSYNYPIPAGVAGLHVISATNAANNYAETAFTITPRITLSAASAGPGELVNISGAGFGFRSNVTIKMGATSVTTARTDDLGSFDLNFNVPDIKSNPYDLTAQDEVGNLVLAQFTVTAGAKLSAVTGGVGSNLTVTGSGFLPGGTIHIDFGIMRVATLTADNDGGFTSTFGVPAVGAGSHAVKVTDGATLREFAYTIESNPPAAPALLLPLDNTSTRIFTSFEWEQVPDESRPVTYHLQVSDDVNFSTFTLDKQGLAEAAYTLSGEEALPAAITETTYYWRVRATDGAGNTGEWSEAHSFLITPPTVPEPTAAAVLNEKGEPVIELEKGEAITLDWSDATGLAGTMLYALEVAGDPDFIDPLITKPTLTGSTYAFTEEEMALLKKATVYYWRVQATDADGLTSGWSESDQFMFGSSFTWPMWATWLLVGIGVIIAAGGAYLLGRRRTQEEQYE